MSNRPISVVELERRRLATAASLSKDLEAITAWGWKNMVEFNASQTQYCALSNRLCQEAVGVSITENMNTFRRLQQLLGKSSDIYSEPENNIHKESKRTPEIQEAVELTVSDEEEMRTKQKLDVSHQEHKMINRKKRGRPTGKE
nr:unnamed protein product [Callosobruchus chinensis]